MKGLRCVTLLALAGQSPGVITETAWALAHEQPPILPDQVIVVTTASGRRTLAEELLASGRWEQLRRQLGCTAGQLVLANIGAHVRVFPNAEGNGELDDIQTQADNEAAADFLLETIRGLTANPETQLILSVAGGRKTMSLLGGLAMSLLGRRGDRLCHVLVAPPFDSPRLEPRFYFPDQTIGHYRMPGVPEPLPPEAADIHLAEVPYPALRYLFEEHFQQTAGGYMNLVRTINGQLGKGVGQPELRLLPSRCAARVDGVMVQLSALEFALLLFCAGRAMQGKLDTLEYGALYDQLGEFLDIAQVRHFPRRAEALDMWRDKHGDACRAMRRLVSDIKRKIAAKVGAHAAAACALTHRDAPGRVGLRLPKTNLFIEKAE